jgi:hypothetical protein
MINATTRQLSQAEFWALADAAPDQTYELINGPKGQPVFGWRGVAIVSSRSTGSNGDRVFSR